MKQQQSQLRPLRPTSSRRVCCGYAVLWAAYAILTWITLWHHELYRDEAYAWLVARDAGFLNIFRVAMDSNHLGLWYLLLWPFAKLGWSCFSMLVIHWLLAIAAVAVFLWRAPFSALTKILFIFSYYMFWEYCLSIRFYTLSILILFLLVAIYRDRCRWPILYAVLLALLLNTNIHIEFLAGGLSLLFIWDYITASKKRSSAIWTSLILLAGLTLFFLQISNFPKIPSTAEQSFKHILIDNEMTALAQAFFVTGQPEVLAPAGLAMLALVGYVLITRPMPLMIFGAHIGGTLVIYLKHTGGVRHHGLILIGALLCLWLATYYPDSERPLFRRIRAYLPDFTQRWRSAMIALNLCLLMALPCGLFMHYLDIKFQYSGSAQMAQFIRTHHLERYPIAAWRDAPTFPVLAYLPNKSLWFAGLNKYGTYYLDTEERRWAFEHVSYDEALLNIEQAFPRNEPLLLLLDRPLDSYQMTRYRLLHKVDQGIFYAFDEQLYLYRRIPLPPTNPAAASWRAGQPGPLPNASAGLRSGLSPGTQCIYGQGN